MDVAGIEPATPCLQSSEIKSMLLARLALFYVSVHGFGPNLAAIGPNLDPNLWGEPLSWHSFFGHSFRFRKSVLATDKPMSEISQDAAFCNQSYFG